MAANTDDLLRLWEDNQRAHPVHRALQALALAAPVAAGQSWAQAPIGARDRALLRLHEEMFGGELHTTAHCPGCGERLESDFSVGDIVAGPTGSPPAALRLQDQDFDVEYRLPTSEDLLQVVAERAAAGDEAMRLLRRCVRSALRDGVAVDPGALPEAVIDRIADGMATQDPDADVQVGLACPACGAAWSLRFDIVSHFWSELDDWAQRMLADVHQLASAYGWSERDILAMSAARRQAYLDMVAA